MLLRAFLASVDDRTPAITGLHKAINSRFEEAAVSIAFPQRDLHMNTAAPLRISIEEHLRGRHGGGNAEV